MLFLELSGHECPVIEQKVLPEGPTNKVVIHIVFGHLNNCSLDVDVEVGPSGSIGSLVGIVKSRKIGGDSIEIAC